MLRSLPCELLALFEVDLRILVSYLFVVYYFERRKIMARITAEDCNKIIPDRFRLVVLATRYAKLLNYKVETNQIKKEKRDKPPVIALRRIAAGKVSVAQLEQDLINSLRTRTMIESFVNQDESEDVEEKFEYLPEVYIGEDYSDLDDQIFIDENGEDYDTDK
ncbi:DNA-directed RNA polymerase omega chain [Rickettsia massiliae MTU5]|uniref:DNA-directed RNA polymerase subunit omega n=2 Tax=Rickettsia massiliae TaxID=35791 RepID=A8F258_RICM5|nr:DNA-directed RNA polymerase omega chain [Rickettsia massiliae MTU5]